MISRFARIGPAAALVAALNCPSVLAQTITYTYDELGRVTGSSVSSSGATTSYTYDAADNRPRVTMYSGAGPHAVNDSATGTAASPITLSVLSNDSSPASYSLSVSSATAGGHGTTVVNSGATVTYTPASGFAGSDAFSYTISDGHGGTATATATVLVPGNPVANTDNMVLAYTVTSQTQSVWPCQYSFDPRLNDTSYMGYPLTITGVSSSTYGAVTYTGSQVSYCYNNQHVHATFSGSDSFTYTVSDGHGGTATGTIYVSISVDGNW